MLTRSLAILLCNLLGLAGCSQPDSRYVGTNERTGKDPHTFYVNNFSEPEYIDPGLTAESAGSTLVNELFEGLGVLHPDDQHPTQGVATRYDQSPDNRLFRFYLREEAKWSDGKPVVAGDFVYAWRRVLTPATGARMATLMYPLKNAKLFHQGSLKLAKEASELRRLDGGTAPIAKGTALLVLATSPAQIRHAPLAAPRGDKLSYDPKTGSLHAGDAAVAGATFEAPASAKLLAVGEELSCNEAKTRWYRVEVGGQQGWLPGCALHNDPKAAEAVVEAFHDLPTFRPPPKPAPPPAPEPETPEPETPEPETPEPETPEPETPAPDTKPAPLRGFIAQSALVSDPSVIGVRASDDHTLEVELAEPTPYFMELVSYATYYPVRQDVIEHFEALGQGDRWVRPGNMVNNGPYNLESHKFRYEITFVRNPHHYDHDKLKIHRIVFVMVADYDATVALYKTGELDFIGQNLSLPAAQMQRLSTKADFDRSDWLATYWYDFNTDKPPVDKVEVRRALALSVDKQQIVEKIARGGQKVATHFVPDFAGSGYAAAQQAEIDAGHPRFSGKGFDYDPAYARELLGQAGYSVEKRGDKWYAPDFPPLEILYNTSEGHQKIAVAIQDMWQRNLGIAVTLRNEEWKVLLKNSRDGHFQIGRSGWIADYNHPHTWLDTFLSYSNNNWCRWSNPKFDALVEQGAATADPAQSMRLYREAESIAVAEMPRLPLYFYTKSTLIKPYMKGYYPNGNNRHNIRWMWIDADWKNNHDNVPSYPPREFPKPGRYE